jgi:hypothetical protein
MVDRDGEQTPEYSISGDSPDHKLPSHTISAANRCELHALCTSVHVQSLDDLDVDIDQPTYLEPIIFVTFPTGRGDHSLTVYHICIPFTVFQVRETRVDCSRLATVLLRLIHC